MLPPPASRPGRAGPWLALLILAGAGVSCIDGPTGFEQVDHVSLFVPSTFLRPGTEMQAYATPVDANGYLIDAGPVRWRSLTPATLSVTEDGLIKALAPGFGLVRASVGPKAGHIAFTLENPPIASIEVPVDTLRLSLPGGVQDLVAVPRDEEGLEVVGELIEWSSEASRIAQVSATGRVTALAVGSTVVTVRVEEVERNVVVLVDAPPTATSPVITLVSPSLALPGTTITVTGTGFSGTPSANVVLIDGTPVPVTASSGTQLALALPPAASWPCEPTRSVAVQVTSPGGIGVGAVTLQVAVQRSLGVGQALILTSIGEARCNELAPGPARYVLTVPNAARSLGTGPMAIAVRGAAVATGAAITGPAISAVAPRSPKAPSGAALRRSARARVHARLLEANRLVATTGRIAGLGATQSTTIASIAPSVGTIVPLRLPALESDNFCSNFTAIGARTVYAGQHVVLLEDTSTVLGDVPTTAGQVDDLLQILGNELDGIDWPILQTFGNALVMDSRLDDDGRVRIVLSPRVNGFFGGAVMAAVVNCDFFRRSQFPSSNVGEYVYAQVPTSTDPGFGIGSRERWFYEVRGTLVHEMKHVISYAERIVRGHPLEETWLEEATARHAEELFARAVYGATRFSDAGVDATLACELRAGDPSYPACDGKPRAMRPHIEGLWEFLDAPATRSPLGSTFADDISFYGSAWSLTRWLMDQETLAESNFFTALTTSSQSGVENIEGRTGRSWDEILPEWSLAMVTDGRAGMTPASTRLRFPSWNLASLFAGLCELAGPCGDPERASPFFREHPFLPAQVQSGAFLVELPVVEPGGFGGVDLAVSGTGARQMIELRGYRGGALPATARLALLRIQ